MKAEKQTVVHVETDSKTSEQFHLVQNLQWSRLLFLMRRLFPTAEKLPCQHQTAQHRIKTIKLHIFCFPSFHVQELSIQNGSSEGRQKKIPFALLVTQNREMKCAHESCTHRSCRTSQEVKSAFCYRVRTSDVQLKGSSPKTSTPTLTWRLLTTASYSNQ